MCSSGVPIYEVPAKSYTGERILEILLDETIDLEKVCHEQPTQITKSSTFVVNMNSLKHPDDVKKDEFGKWCYSGSHSQVYQAWASDDDDVEYKKVNKADCGENTFILRRINCKHPTSSQLQRLLAFVTGLSIYLHNMLTFMSRCFVFRPTWRSSSSVSCIVSHSSWL